MNSASSFSGSYHASCTSDAGEDTYLKRTRILHCLRVGIAVTLLVVAVAVIGCEAVPLQHYRKTSPMSHAWLTLWPVNFDLRPTTALLACGCVIAFQVSIYLSAALIPSPYSRIRMMNSLAAAVSVSGFVTALVGVLFALYLPSSTYPPGFTVNETLQSWTCKWADPPKVAGARVMVSAPIHFARDCKDSRAGFVLLCVLLGLEAVMGFAAAAGYLLERNVAKENSGSSFEVKHATYSLTKA